MAHSLSAKKRVRQNATHRARNRWRLRQMRGALRSFHEAIATGTPDEAKQAYAECQKVIDRTAQRGVIHKNQASRRKSRLVKMLKTKLGV